MRRSALLLAVVAATASSSLAAAVAQPNPRPYTAAQVRRAFVAAGVGICAGTGLPGCAPIYGGGGSGGPDSLTWFATVRESGFSYDLVLTLYKTSAWAAQLFTLSAYGEQAKKGTYARLGNLTVEVGRAEHAPASQPRTTREFPAPVRRALALLTGTRQTATGQQRLCRRLAAQPLPGAAAARGGPCPTLPAVADSDELFVASLPKLGSSQVHIRYQIYGSVRTAKLSWPRDADMQPSGYAIGGTIPGLGKASIRWLPQPPFQKGAAATVLVGPVLATVELEPPSGTRADIAGAVRLVRRVAAYLKTVEAHS